ncbi:minor capsid protein [Niallia sp. RD1]|uniref:minor capsid protein n=1 Tax=Niallia sp. RD1 TaxID=2962858 RepID=UPI0020C1B14E|nr:minor capsid protein [Niallia sp. RD1]UTI41121.1 minor capsid protein [Niallia sp. RD1]
MDFLDRMLDKLESDVTLFTFVRKGLLAEGNSIAVRQTPTPPNTTYLNKDRIDNYGFQFLVRHKDVLTAENTIQSIHGYLCNRTDIESHDDSFKLINIDVSTMPNWVGVSERGEYEYTAIFQAELQINGGINNG